MAASRFFKYEGAGNDFIVVDLRATDAAQTLNDPQAALRLCDRHFGIGADGILPILPPRTPDADARMRVLNADGSQAEMCGNGIRCVAKHLVDRGGVHKDVVHIDTDAGVLACRVFRGRSGEVETVAVEMGRPRLTRGELPMTGGAAERVIDEPFVAAGHPLRITCVSMGNPHAVAFVPEHGPALRALAERVGPAVEHDPAFPRRINAEFAHLHDDGSIELVVWERGCGITLACGTGACATAVAACLTGRAPRGQELAVRLLGGTLGITVAEGDAGVTMRGPARLVFTGDA